MVRITVIKELVKKYSVKKVLQKTTDKLKGVDMEARSAVSEAMIRHDIDRQTIPKNPNIRKALLSLHLEKEFDSITGKDLYDLIETNNLAESVKSKFLKLKFDSDSLLPQPEIFNLLKNYEYGKYSEGKYVETICVLLNWKFDDVSFKDTNWRQIVTEHISNLMTSEEFLDIEKNLPLNTPLTKVGETSRIECYKSIIAKLITLK